MKKRILFIQPSLGSNAKVYAEMPLGIGLLATICEAANYTVSIYDEQMEEVSLTNKLFTFEPDIIGISITTPAYSRALEILKITKKLFPSVPVIAGGKHPTSLPEEVLNDSFDCVVVGRAEGSILNIISNLLSSKPINGIIFGQALLLSEIPIINRSLFDGSYHHNTIITSIGCPFKCAFCANSSTSFQKQSMNNVLKELHFILKSSEKNKTIFFADNNLFYDKKSLTTFCNAISNLNLNFMIQNRTDTLDTESLLLLKSVGCSRILFGIESGSTKILNNVNKTIDLKHIYKIVKTCKQIGITARTNWIIGLPGSWKEEMESLAFIRYLHPTEISLHQFIPMPGSAIWRDPQKYKVIIKDPNDYSSYNLNTLTDNFLCSGYTYNDIYNLFKTYKKEFDLIGYSPIGTTNKNEYTYSMPLLKTYNKI